MSSLSPLSGTVSKAVLLVCPAYAQEKELLHLLKYKLCDAGFIVCREEHRRINAELAEELCVQWDYTPAYMHYGEDSHQTAVLPEALMPSAADMVGNAYIYVLAHRNCHAELQRFLLKNLLSTSSDVDGDGASADGASSSAVTYNSLVAAIAAAKWNEGDNAEEEENEGRVPPPAVFIHRTADGARKAVSRLFPQMLAADVPTAAQSREYVQAHLKTALLPALTELSKRKPEDPLRWLAEQLLLHNPASPPMVNEGV